MKYELSPSILSADFARLGEEIKAVEQTGVNYLHIDVMDGMFVSNISIGVPVVKSLRKFTDQFLDVHLMIEKPVRYVDAFADAGADLLTVHLEADMPPGIQAALAAMERRGVRKGIALRPITAAEAVLPYLDKVDLILVMTVEPGFGGQAFMADQLPKIAAIRPGPYGVELVLDGVNSQLLAQYDETLANSSRAEHAMELFL